MMFLSINLLDETQNDNGSIAAYENSRPAGAMHASHQVAERIFSFFTGLLP
jgi:hypothetical protein